MTVRRPRHVVDSEGGRDSPWKRNCEVLCVVGGGSKVVLRRLEWWRNQTRQACMIVVGKTVVERIIGTSQLSRLKIYVIFWYIERRHAMRWVYD